jgi:hypothetical protein
MQDAAAVPDAPRETAAAATCHVGIHSPGQRQHAAAIGRLPAEVACAVLGFADVVTEGSCLVGLVCADAARSHQFWSHIKRYLVLNGPWCSSAVCVPLRLFQGKIDEWCSDCFCVACMQLRLCLVGQTSMSDIEWLRPDQAGPCLWCTVMT